MSTYRDEPLLQRPASPEAIADVLSQPTDGNDGRSEWQWFWVIDGFEPEGGEPTYSLILGVFPQGDTFMRWETEHS